MVFTIGGELYHYGKAHDENPPGRGSGRYPWGSGKHKLFKKKEKDRVTKNEQKKEETPEEREERKKKALSGGSAKDVLEFQGELTNTELLNVINRLDYEGKLKAIASKDVKSTMDKIDDAINKIDKVRGWAEKGVSAYNLVAKVVNSLDGGDLPIISNENNKASRYNKELDRKNKELDNKIKSLTAENSKLKNEGQALKNKEQELINKGEKLKNKQTKMNIENQIEKKKKK
jgi:hypothetical protein